MSALPGYAWAWAAGAAAGFFGGALYGQWMTWLTLRNPLACVIRAYRELWAGILRLCATGELPCPPHQQRHHPQLPARTLPLFLGQLRPPVQPLSQQRRKRGPRHVQQRRQA